MLQRQFCRYHCLHRAAHQVIRGNEIPPPSVCIPMAQLEGGNQHEDDMTIPSSMKRIRMKKTRVNEAMTIFQTTSLPLLLEVDLPGNEDVRHRRVQSSPRLPRPHRKTEENTIQVTITSSGLRSLTASRTLSRRFTTLPAPWACGELRIAHFSTRSCFEQQTASCEVYYSPSSVYQTL